MKGARELAVGERFELGDYRVTEEEIISFATQWDPQYFHIDPRAAAESSPFGGVIASGLHSMAIMQRLCVQSLYSQWKTIAGRFLDDVQFLRPVRPGDVLTGSARIDEIAIDEERGRGDVVLTIELSVEGRPVLSTRCGVVLGA